MDIKRSGARSSHIGLDGCERATLGRRSFLRGALAGAASMVIGALMSGCSNPSPTSTPPVEAGPESTPIPPTAIPPTAARPTSASVASEATALVQPTSAPSTTAQPTPASTGSGSKVLLAYFSRAGENYYYGERTILEVGNTEVLAGMIANFIGCDIHRIEPVAPYPDDYEETVEQNHREQDANARPAIANLLASIESYDTVLLGSPIWGGRTPMIMSTFVEGFDFSGKTVIPFVTYAVSGLGTTVRDYTASCPGATIGEGLAVRGEEVRDAGAAVEAWLRRINLLQT